MAEFKIVLSTKDGKSYQREVKENDATIFLGKRIGDKIKGDDFGMPGFEVQITGGSDFAGFPMRKDVSGANRKKILAVKGIGLKKKRDGQRQRKTVCGNKIFERTAQINLKVLKEGKEKLAGLEEAPAPTKNKEAAPAETPKAPEEKKVEAKEEPKNEKKTEEKPSEDKKE